MGFTSYLVILIAAAVVVTPFIALRYWIASRKLTQRADFLESLTYATLQIDVPRNNEKSPLSAEQFFASLHGILRDDVIMQEHVSFEIVASSNAIHFFVFVPVHLQEFVEGQMYAQYPDVHISRVEDYSRQVAISGLAIAQTKLLMTKDPVYPIRTFMNFDVDPLAGITAVLSKLGMNEQVWLQFCVRPLSDNWQKKGLSHINSVRSGKKKVSALAAGGNLVASVAKEIASPGSSAPAADKPVELSGPVTEALSGIESKITKLGYEVIIRVLAIGETEQDARTRIQSVVGAFKQFNTTNMNGFNSGPVVVNDTRAWGDYLNRSFEEKGLIFNTEELASLYHFPNQSVETPNLSWAGAKKGEAPANLPIKGETVDSDITLIGKTDFRNTEKIFGIKLLDRMQHVYIIGKSGGGKSKLMLNMITDDVMEGRGVIVVDPHGDLAEEAMSIIPSRRIEDVIIFDPADREFPVAFNLLENVDDDYKSMVTSGFVGIFKKIFGYSWGPRLEHILRNTVLALLDYPESTMLSIPRMLTERAFREQVIDFIKDPVIQNFWINEFGSMDSKFQTEAVSPILNKVGQFLSTPTIRNIVGQPRTAIDLRQIMDQSKILIVNLSRGKIGEDNAALMGSMIITKVQLAAMSRADMPVEQRSPCFLYVDEFQNFATESFAVILSEARKYGLGLTLAHQFINQMPEEVRDAVFGNVGTSISFRVGAADAEYLAKELAPVFDATDLVNLEKYHIYIKLLVDGLASAAFSAVTLPPPAMTREHFATLYDFTHSHYASNRSDVEQTIEEWSGMKERVAARSAAKEAGELLRTAISAQHPAARPAPATPAPAPVRPAPAPVAAVPTPAAPVAPAAAPVATPVAAPIAQVAAPAPVEEPVSAPAPVQTVPAAPLPATDQPVPEGQGSALEGEVKVKQPYQPKPLRAIGNRVYKEHTQRGGQKWFVGEPLELAVGREQDRYNRSIKPPLSATEPPQAT